MLTRRSQHYAAENGSVETVRLLVGAGAEVDSLTSYGSTALHWACEVRFFRSRRLAMRR